MIFGNKKIKVFGVYMGTSILNKALPFFLLPVMTKYLSPAEYGVLAIFHAILSFAAPIVGMNMQNNITRNFFTKPKDYIARLTSNILIILLATTILVVIGLMLYTFFFKTVADIPVKWFILIPFIASLQMINQFNLTILRNQQKAFVYGIFQILGTLLNLSISLILVVAFRYGWEGRAFATCSEAAVLGGIALIYLIKTQYLKWNFDFKVIKEVLGVSIPLIFYSLGGMIIFLSDRLFIDRMVGKEAVGIYAVGYAFGMIVIIFKDALTKTWSPWMYKQLAQTTKDSHIKIVRCTYIINICMLFLALGVTLISYVLLKYMIDIRYASADQIIVWIALGSAVNAMYSLFVPYAVHEGKTRRLAVIMGFAAVINLLLNYLLISLNGSVGAAQATLLTYIFCLLMNWGYANSIYPMPWFDWKILRLENEK